MLHKAAAYTAQRLLRSAGGDREDLDVYVYGIECFFADALQLLLLAAVAAMLRRPAEVLAFTLAFGAVKSRAGGYHARTHAGCMASFTLAAAGQALLIPLAPVGTVDWITAAAAVCAVILLLVYAPITHPNHPKSQAKQIKTRRACVGIACVLPILVFILHRWAPVVIGLPAATGFLGAALTLPIAKGGETAWKRNRDAKA